MNDLITQMAQCVVNDAGDRDWDSLTYNLVCVTTFSKEKGRYKYNGAEKSFSLTHEDDGQPERAPITYALQLRQAMYDETPDKGAWYTLNLTIGRDGKFKLDVDYDNKPNFNIEIEEERYVWDTEKYPAMKLQRPTGSKPS